MIFGFIAQREADGREDGAKASEPEVALYRPLAARIAGPDVEGEIVGGPVLRLLAQPGPLLHGQRIGIVIGDQNPARDPLFHLVGFLLAVVALDIFVFQCLESVRLDRLRWDGPSLLVDHRFGIEMVLILDGREVQHDAAKELVARAIRGQVPVGDLPALFLDPEFGDHQPEQQIDVHPLPQQQRELALFKRRQQPLREFFPFDRHDADRRVLRYASAEDRKYGLATHAGQRRRHAAADAEVEGRRDVRDAGEVNRLAVLGAGDVDQQLLGEGVRDGLVIGHHDFIEADGGETSGQDQTG